MENIIVSCRTVLERYSRFIRVHCALLLRMITVMMMIPKKQKERDYLGNLLETCIDLSDRSVGCEGVE
jgi:hypothetical protein